MPAPIMGWGEGGGCWLVGAWIGLLCTTRESYESARASSRAEGGVGSCWVGFVVDDLECWVDTLRCRTLQSVGAVAEMV